MKERLTESGTGHVGQPQLDQSTGFAEVDHCWLYIVVRSDFPATLREIFDESAYARFLSERQLASSRAAYASFRREYEVTKARRPRCC